VIRIVALPLVVFALQPFHSSIRTAATASRQVARGFWHSGCPVPLSGLRLLTVSHWEFHGRARANGQLVVSGSYAGSLARTATSTT
jgi:hypothetical protein